MAYSPFNKQVFIKFDSSETEGAPLNDDNINNLATALDMEIKTLPSEITINEHVHSKYLAFKNSNDGFLIYYQYRSSSKSYYKIARIKDGQLCSDGYDSCFWWDNSRQSDYVKVINLNEKTKIFYYDAKTGASYYWVYIITYYYDEESKTEKMLTLCSNPSDGSNTRYMGVYVDNKFIGNVQINYKDIDFDTTLYGENYCAMIPFKLDNLNCAYDKLYLVTNRTGFKYGTVFSLNGKKFVIISGTYYSDSASSSYPMKLAISCD